jgi:hypothetical protein
MSSSSATPTPLNQPSKLPDPPPPPYIRPTAADLSYVQRGEDGEARARESAAYNGLADARPSST